MSFTTKAIPAIRERSVLLGRLSRYQGSFEQHSLGRDYPDRYLHPLCADSIRDGDVSEAGIPKGCYALAAVDASLQSLSKYFLCRTCRLGVCLLPSAIAQIQGGGTGGKMST